MHRLLTSRAWPLAPQIAAAAACAATMVALAFGPADPELNPGMYLLWAVWWSVLPLSFVALGRIWCAICPVSLLGDGAERVFPGRPALPGPVGGSGAATIVFSLAAVHLANLWFQFEEDRRATGLLIAAFGSAALLLTLAFSGRWWCRSLCPVGALGGLLARLSPLRIANGVAPCPRECAERACTVGHAGRALCPVRLDLRAGIDPGSCILCGACLKACPRLGGIGWGAGDRDRAATGPTSAESLAVLAFLGLAVDMALTHLVDWPIIFWRLAAVAGIDAGPWTETAFHAAIIAALPFGALSLLLVRRVGAAAESGLAAFALPALPLAGAAVLALWLRPLLVEGPLHLQRLLLAAGWDGALLLGGVRRLDGIPLRAMQEGIVVAGGIAALFAVARRHGGGRRREALAGAITTLAAGALLLWAFSRPLIG